MGLRTLYLIRHGQHFPEAPQDTELGSGLTELGQAQAHRIAQRLHVLPIDSLHFSSLRRTAETAAIIAAEFPELPQFASNGLWECIPAIPPLYEDQFRRRFLIEELEGGRRQAEEAFGRYFQPNQGPDQQEIIVSHGNLIRYLVLRALMATPEAWVNLEMANCGLSVINIEPDGTMKVVSHNDTGHLAPEMVTFL